VGGDTSAIYFRPALKIAAASNECLCLVASVLSDRLPLQVPGQVKNSVLQCEKAISFGWASPLTHHQRRGSATIGAYLRYIAHPNVLLTSN